MLYPLTFHPIFKERIWGGRTLEEVFQKPLPSGARFGESWEISDRPGDASVIANGPWQGRDLRWLMTEHAADLLGHDAERFPLLVKILDCRQKLSLQVHPPAGKAGELGGEPKTEMWYVAQAEPGSELWAGLRRGVTPAEFRAKAADGTVADCFHRLRVEAGDVMFLPSGRVHALGAGLLIFEIQQNSDTTYRVFDWNRVDQEGNPRELHIEKSMASIDFEDFEPSLVRPQPVATAPGSVKRLVTDPLFCVEEWKLETSAARALEDRTMQVLGVLRGRLHLRHLHTELSLGPGQFCLVPACLVGVTVRAESAAVFLRAHL